MGSRERAIRRRQNREERLAEVREPAPATPALSVVLLTTTAGDVVFFTRMSEEHAIAFEAAAVHEADALLDLLERIRTRAIAPDAGDEK
ncbi:MAG: hypothetical protein Q8Q14_16975 [Gemmatimonadales bacterium]|nr:hypothetical protein [Gemmatimonadales bacterium]